MTKQNLTSTIQSFVKEILHNTITDSKAEVYINTIHKGFIEANAITGYEFNIEYLAAVPTARGKALGLNHAAQCLLDYKRTTKFVKAIVSVILEGQTKNPDKVIKVFYAGCGPYATLFSLVAPYFQQGTVQFSLLEINANALAAAKKLINYLELTACIENIYCADAVTFKVPEAHTYDIVISETLDALLYRECYVPIVFNLLPQFKKDVVLIPENVLIDVYLSNLSEDKGQEEETKIKTVVNVRKELQAVKDSDTMPAILPENIIDFTTHDMNRYEKLLLETRVQVHDNLWLDRNESSLTIPYESLLAKPFESSSAIFTYHLEPEIELKCMFK